MVSLEPHPTLVLYAQTSAMSRIILGNPGIKFEKRGADYTVVDQLLSSTFCTNCENKSLDKSLRVWHNMRNDLQTKGQIAENLRKFWQIRCKKHLTAAISYAAPRNKFMLGVWQKLFDIGNRSLYNFYKSEELYERYSIRSL